MTPENLPVRRYFSDAPPLPPHPGWGALQLLFWLLFHPSAWRNYLSRLDPDLKADFSLVELSLHQWRNPAIRGLLRRIYLFLPLWSGLGFILLFWWVGISVEDYLATVLHFVVVALMVSLIFGAVINVAAGVMGGIGVAGLVALAGSLRGDPLVNEIIYHASVALSLGIVGATVQSLTGQWRASFGRQIGGIVIGIIVGVAAISLTRRGLTLAVQLSGLPIDAAFFTARSFVIGLSFGLALAWRRKTALAFIGGGLVGLLYESAFLVIGSEAPTPIRGLFSGIPFGVSLAVTFLLPYLLATHVAGPQAGVWAGVLGSFGRHIVFATMISQDRLQPISPETYYLMGGGFAAVGLGLTIKSWGPVLFYPFAQAWNLLLFQADSRQPGTPRYFHRHSAFWEEGQPLPLRGLDDYLLMVFERDPQMGQAASDYLLTTPQRWAVRAAQIERDARNLEACGGVMAIRASHTWLSSGDFPASDPVKILRDFGRVSRDVDVALSLTTPHHQQRALAAVADNLAHLRRDLTHSRTAHAFRFYPIASRWQQIVSDRIDELAMTAAAGVEIDSPYIIGVPLMPSQDIFVGRRDISTEIERFLLDERCPPIFLYGQRRVGKTSLLNNLGRLLPGTVLPLFVDLQGPAAWSADHAGFLYTVGRAMIAAAEQQSGIALPILEREMLQRDPFGHFDDWLDLVEMKTVARGLTRLLLALDEFEALTDSLAEGRLDERAILGMLRHLIQHRPRFKVLLAASHTPAEFERWASYLINVRLLHLSYLTESEAFQLIERPVEGFPLRYRPEAGRRILELTRGHPFLIQLLCNEIVACKNSQPITDRHLATLADVEVAVEKALNHGGLYFADIARNQVDRAGLAILRHLAQQADAGPIDRAALAAALPSGASLNQTLDALRQRDLIEVAGDGYRFQVELIRRWFAQTQSA